MRLTNRWLVLVVLIIATMTGIMAFAAPFALLPVWVRELGLSKAAGGLLSGLWYLPGMVVALPAGWAFDHYPARRVMALLWCFIVAGVTIMAGAQSFWVLCAGRLLFSVGMNAHLIGAPKLIGNWFAGRRELGFAMGLYTLAFTVGVFLSLNVLGEIGATRGSAAALRVMATLTAIGFVLTALVPAAPRAVEPPTSPPSPSTVRPWTLGIGAWVLGVAYFGFSIGTEAYLTFAPDFLVGTGLALGVASATVSAYGLVAFVLKPVLSGFLNRERAPRFVVLAVVAALASIVVLLTGVAPVASSSLMGVALALGMPAFLALPALLFPSSRSGQVYGLYQLLYSAGFFAQPLVGLVADRTGSYMSAFAVVAVYTALGLGVASPWVRQLRPPPLAPGTP